MSDETVVPCNGQSILIVDDDNIVLRTFLRILADDMPDWHCEGAATGAEAVEQFRAMHPCIVLMEIYLPIMDGLEAFSQIERECAARNWEMSQVIFCSGFFPPTAVDEIINTKPQHSLLHKPVTRKQLVAAIADRVEYTE